MAIFDFPQTILPRHIYERAQNLLNNPIEGAYLFAMKLFDSNNDSFICHRDLFQLLVWAEKYPYLKKDFRLIHEVFEYIFVF